MDFKIKKPGITIASIVLLALLVVFLASGNSETTQKSNSLNKNSVKEGSEKGYFVPDFKVTSINGEIVSRESIIGKTAILQGFASWCSSCAIDAQTISKVYPEFKDENIMIVSFDIQQGETPAQITRFMINALGGIPGNEWKWTLFNPKIVRQFNLTTLDATLVVNNEGIITYRDNGITNESQLRNALEKTIKNGAA